MASRQEAQLRLFELLDPSVHGAAKPAAEVDLMRFAFMILLCTHANVFASTFPGGGRVATLALRDEWFTEKEIPDSVVEGMLEYRATFAAAQRAWFKLSEEYQDPPCPTNARFHALVDFIKTKL